ncbi:arginine--tRNA ligase [Candidatus Nanohalococcus occultus]|uniref:arginine--tRNA ligase n=1 Tax=Candidatus Nanohalococcus occultus TaxID=2978047 RepID=UPI0039E1881F
MKKVKRNLADELEEALGAEVDLNDIEVPDGEHGDFAYPAMKAASELGDSPRNIAEKAKDTLEELDFVEKIEIAGPGYVNFFLDKKFYTEEVFETLDTEMMGVERKDGNALVEFSSPNLAKPMHVGHLRNNVLGDSLQRIMRFAGYDVTSENYIGDWGTKHGQVIYGYKLWGDEQKFQNAPMDHMYELYVKLNQEADEEMQETAREWSKKIEDGDKEAVELWERFREATIEYNEVDYERMNIHFDRVTGESVVAEHAEELIEEGLEKGIFEKDDDGSVYVEFEDEDLPSTIIKRSDGSTLYLTRDLANIIKRENEEFDYNFYVVATEQNLHFKQLFAVAKQFGVEDIVSEHISYGLLHLEDGSISSSKGNIITLRDVLDEAKEKAQKVDEREIGNAEAVGQGALKYANLSVSRQKDIEFSWDRALSFEGDSGPYLQYSNVRAKSILRKTEVEGKLNGEFNQEEYRLVKKLGEFPEKVDNAVEARDPAKIANYLSSLCEVFNSFYHSQPVLDADEKDRKRRVALIENFISVTDKGLDLLGIEALEEM